MELENFFITLGFLGIEVVLSIIISFIITYIINGLMLYKFFKKTGKNPYAGFIPFYGDWVIIKVSECHLWYYIIIIGYSVLNLFVNPASTGINSIFMSLYSIVVLYLTFCINYNIAKKFKQGIGFAIGMTLLPIVFYLILGISENYVYDKNVEVNPYGFYDFNERKSVIYTEKRYCSNCGTEMSSNFCPKCGKSKKGV